jgi:phage-related protein
MQSLKAYVLGRGAALIDLMMSAYGFGQGDIQYVLSVFVSALYGVFGDALTIPFGVLIWLYDQISNIRVTLPSWVTWLYNYVTGYVSSTLQWLISSVQYLNSALQDIPSDILTTVNNVVSAAFSVWMGVLTYAQYIYNNFGWLLIRFLSDTFGFISSVISQAFPVIYPLFTGLLQFFASVLQPSIGFITQFLSDPAGFVTGIFHTLIDAALMPLRPLLDFLAWWSNTGAPFLVQLTADPVKVLLDILAPSFIDWLLELLAEHW